MDSFLDTTVIIKYLEYDYIKEQLRKKCFEYIESSNGGILISLIVEEELRRVIIKRKEMYENVIKKIKDSSFQINYKNSNFLNKEDCLFAEKLYINLKEKDTVKLKKEFDSEINFLNASLIIFLKNKVSEASIKESELNQTILSIIHEFIEDFADCRVLTSAIQIQQGREQFAFITADKHIDKGSYNFIEEELRLKDYKKPILKNLLYEN